MDLLLECSFSMMLLGQHVKDSCKQHTEAAQLPVFYLHKVSIKYIALLVNSSMKMVKVEKIGLPSSSICISVRMMAGT